MTCCRCTRRCHSAAHSGSDSDWVKFLLPATCRICFNQIPHISFQFLMLLVTLLHVIPLLLIPDMFVHGMLAAGQYNVQGSCVKQVAGYWFFSLYSLDCAVYTVSLNQIWLLAFLEKRQTEQRKKKKFNFTYLKILIYCIFIIMYSVYLKVFPVILPLWLCSF